MDKNRLINTFLESVQIDSTTGHEGKMADWVFGKLKSLGLDPIRDSFGNIITKVPGSRDSIILAAHLDTVEPGRGIKPILENGIVKSSGETILGADNKAAVAAILETVETIVKEDIQTCPIEIVFTLSEEVGNYGAVNLDYSQIESKSGFSFDANGSIGDIIIASPFYNRFDIQITGISAHASKPEIGVNSLSILSDALAGFKLGRVDENSICNIGVFEGGSVRNTVPGDAFIKGEVRSFTQAGLIKTTRRIIECFENSAKKFSGNIKSEVVRENGGYKLSKSDPVVRRTARVLRGFKLSPKLIESYGCADANIFADHGIKMINISDGSKNSHTSDECISIEDLYTTARVVLGLVNLE